jgi:alpha-1,2-mannosyltransferase
VAAGQFAPVDGRSAAVGRTADGWLVVAGLAALGAALLWFAHLALPRRGLLAYPLDLSVYRDAGLIVRHVRPFYQAGRASPLYGWPGPPRHLGLTYIYTPFAALPFSLMSYLSLNALGELFTLADLAAVPSAIWITFGALGWPRGARRLGLTLPAAAVALMTEPVLRTINLGQVEIVLMILVV